MHSIYSGRDSRYESLREFPTVITVPVHWGDQDAFRHVNNVVYFRWCESARIYYLERIGLWGLIEKENVGPILAAINCNYRRPVAFPDTVHVGARVSRIGNSSFRMEHRIVSESLNVTVADSDSTLVVFDYNRQEPVPMPPEVRRAIEEHESMNAVACL